jgi:hypothetical protein
MVLRPKPSNRPASSVLHTRSPPSDACHLHGQHGHSHVPSRLSMSQVSASVASHPASGSLGPSLTSVLHPSGPSARHVLLDLHLTVGYRLRAPHLHNTSQETCRTQGFCPYTTSSSIYVEHVPTQVDSYTQAWLRCRKPNTLLVLGPAWLHMLKFNQHCSTSVLFDKKFSILD